MSKPEFGTKVRIIDSLEGLLPDRGEIFFVTEGTEDAQQYVNFLGGRDEFMVTEDKDGMDIEDGIWYLESDEEGKTWERVEEEA